VTWRLDVGTQKLLLVFCGCLLIVVGSSWMLLDVGCCWVLLLLVVVLENYVFFAEL